jgi:hypothetical protein
MYNDWYGYSYSYTMDAHKNLVTKLYPISVSTHHTVTQFAVPPAATCCLPAVSTKPKCCFSRISLLSVRRKVDIFVAVDECMVRLCCNRAASKLFDDAVTPSAVSSFGIIRLSLLLNRMYGVLCLCLRAE